VKALQHLSGVVYRHGINDKSTQNAEHLQFLCPAYQHRLRADDAIGPCLLFQEVDRHFL
jgi:hypothetical protein